MKAIGLSAADLTDFDDSSFTGDQGVENDGDDEGDDDFDDDCGTRFTPLPHIDRPDYSNKPLPEEFYYYAPVRRNGFDVEFLDDEITNDSDDEPDMRSLFGDFWFESELCILFADTGKGKSVLAYQIAESLATGVPVEPYTLEVPAQKVLYFDCEMSLAALRKRYSSEDGSTGPYRFSRNVIRAKLSRDPEYPEYYASYSQFIHESLEEILRLSDARIVIVDNITFLNNSTNEAGPRAFRLMSALQRLKDEYKMSMLVLAHSPKRRFAQPVTVNDLHGSKMLSNFADSVFAIAGSRLGTDLRYLKHIKQRNSASAADDSTVSTFRIEKQGNFLGFHFIGTGAEREHLIPSLQRNTDRRLLLVKVRQMRDLGYTQRKIAERLGISIATVNRYLKKK
jgi:DNA-binding NarL/FixJ family response regulator